MIPGLKVYLFPRYFRLVHIRVHFLLQRSGWAALLVVQRVLTYMQIWTLPFCFVIARPLKRAILRHILTSHLFRNMYNFDYF